LEGLRGRGVDRPVLQCYPDHVRLGDAAMATVAERVIKFLQDKRGNAICDDCIAREMGLSRRQQAYHVTNVLGLTRDYERQIGPCSHCKEAKSVTAAL
jgi:AraC-like DNA-binding protein